MRAKVLLPQIALVDGQEALPGALLHASLQRRVGAVKAQRVGNIEGLQRGQNLQENVGCRNRRMRNASVLLGENTDGLVHVPLRNASLQFHTEGVMKLGNFLDIHENITQLITGGISFNCKLKNRRVGTRAGDRVRTSASLMIGLPCWIARCRGFKIIPIARCSCVT
jgi:hypothetical protein